MIQFSSVARLCPNLRPHGLQQASIPIHHQLAELAETHVHQIGDAIQPSHPLSFLSPLAFSLSQHQGIFQSQFFTSCGQSIEAEASASILPMNIQDWFPLGCISIYDDWKSIALTRWTFDSKIMSLFFFFFFCFGKWVDTWYLVVLVTQRQ